MGDAPVVGFRERRLLVPEQPPMAVRRMDDVDIAPDERSARWSEVRLGIRASGVLVRVSVFVILAGTCVNEQYRGEERGEQCAELHLGDLGSPRGDGERRDKRKGTPYVFFYQPGAQFNVIENGELVGNASLALWPLAEQQA